MLSFMNNKEKESNKDKVKKNVYNLMPLMKTNLNHSSTKNLINTKDN